MEDLYSIYSSRNPDTRYVLNALGDTTDLHGNPSGGALLYLPSSGVVGVRTDSGKYLRTPFAEYSRGIFGFSDKVEIIDRDGVSRWRGSSYITPCYDSAAVNDGGLVIPRSFENVHHILNNKFNFQNIVRETLGPKYSTNPDFIAEGMTVSELVSKVGPILKKNMGKNICIRTVAGDSLNGSGGCGVFYFNDMEFVIRTLRERKIITASDELAESLLVEDFIPHNLSPSITGYIDSKGGSIITIANQLLEGCLYKGSTSILPSALTPELQAELIEKSTLLVNKIASLGAVGFIGFDCIIKSNGEIIFIECNYRETGSSKGWFHTRRVDNFLSNNSTWAQWIFLPGNKYDTSNIATCNLEAVVDTLSYTGALYMGKVEEDTDLDRPKVIISSGGLSNKYGLVFFWDRSKLRTGRALDDVSNTLGNLGLNRNIVNYILNT